MSGTHKEVREKICVKRFLNWYKGQHRKDYIYEKTQDYCPELKGQQDWDFIAYESDKPQEFIGIEVKELATTRKVSRWSEFWDELCLELTRDLESRGIQGKFTIINPPVLNLKPEERLKFRRAFVEVLTNKLSTLERDFVDIGPDIFAKFPNWPKEKSEPFDEYDKWRTYRPCKLEIKKISDSGCEVISPISPIRVRDAVELNKKTFYEADIKHANNQLESAREKGARKTILLFACYPFIEEGLIKEQVQKLDLHLVSNIDYIYLVDMGNEHRVVKIYPD